LDFKYPGKIFPVNAGAAARGEKIQGLDAWNLENIKEQIDLVYITVPARQVPDELRKCAKKNFKSIIILTAGFKETGKEGRKIEDECAKIIKEHGLRVIGPNCFGIYHPKGGVTLLPGGEFPHESGNVAMLSQSGGHSVNFVLIGQSNCMRFSKVISYGNAVDLDLPDFLECLNEDPETDVIASYVEGVRDTEKFKNIIRQFRKTLVLWKSGLTEDGARAAASHTGFLSGQSEIWKGFFRQFRDKLIAVNNFEELLDTTKALAFLPKLDKNIDYRKQIGVIGGGGGIGIEISDVANQYGLKIPKLTAETQEQLKLLLPPDGTSINNPLDIGTPMFMGNYKRILEIFLEDPNISILINDFIIDFVVDMKAVFRVIRNYLKDHKIPIIVILRQLLKPAESLALEKKYRKFRDRFQEIRVPIYPSFYRGIRALANYLRYYSFNSIVKGESKT
ncbi:MAG: CoA-binding protein, partial [Candidatus Helarchaeota archaeon]